MVLQSKAYAAFISYRHATHDREWAIRIFEALETYRIPKSLQRQGYPERIGRLFRDEDEIPASGDLSDEIKHALAHSSTLIVICSPETPKSKWVRREISLFQEMGRGDRIIPVLISGDPDVSFPPELLRRRVEKTLPDGTNEVVWEDFEPLAADVRVRADEPASKTHRRALLRLAASIIGVSFDDLYQREAARRKAEQRRIAASAGFVLLAAAGASGWYWNTYLRTKTLYCANYGERWGVPFCVGEMGEGSAKQQRSVYQFKVKAGLPIEINRVNGSLATRGAPETVYETEDWTKDAARIVYGYQANGSLIRATEYSQTGKQLRRLAFEFSEDGQSGIVRFDSGFGVAELQRAEGGSLGSVKSPWEDTDTKRTNIGQHRLIFDGAGYLLERRFEALGGGVQASDAGGAYGRFYRYGPLGLVDSIRNIDALGDTLVDKTGVAEVRHSHDSAGRLTSVSWHNKSGQLVTNDKLFARAVFSRDALGRVSSAESFDAGGKPALAKDWGHAKIVFIHDARGNVVENDFFGGDGQPIYYKDGYAIARASYDDRGNIVEAAFFGGQGQPVLNKDGYGLLRTKYDGRGNVIENAYFTSDGQPVLNKNGISIIRLKYDERGNLIEAAYSGTDGKPGLNKEGFAALRRKYDARGSMIEEAYFDSNGLPALCPRGYATMRMKYDERGNTIEWAYLGTDGQLVAHKDGNAILRKKYDERGDAIEWAFFGADGRPVALKAGYALLRQQYDERGNPTEWALFGVDGKPARHINGHSLIQRKYDLHGNMIEETIFGADGRPVLGKTGFATFKAKYDERGNKIEDAYFGIDGKPVLHKDGYAVQRKKFDEHANIIEWAYFGLDGKPIVQRYGYAILRKKYNERGNAIETAYFNAEDRPVELSKGYAILRHRFDARGNIIEAAYFGVQGEPVIDSDGYAILRTKYDERGNAIEVAYFDFKGNPANNKTGYARAAWTSDEAGRRGETSYFDSTGAEVRFELAVAEVLPNSTAQRIALVQGDRILAYNGKTVNTIPKFLALTQDTAGTAQRSLSVRRGTDTLSLDVPPGPLGVHLELVKAEGEAHPGQ